MKKVKKILKIRNKFTRAEMFDLKQAAELAKMYEKMEKKRAKDLSNNILAEKRCPFCECKKYKQVGTPPCCSYGMSSYYGVSVGITRTCSKCGTTWEVRYDFNS